MNKSAKNKILRSIFIIIAIFILIIFLICLSSCTEEQIQKADQAIKDVNSITGAVNETIQNSPISPLIPAPIKMFAGIAALAASVGVNFWQKVKGNLVKKTLKTIVAGVEDTTNERKDNPSDPIKANIKSKMEAAHIFDKANRIVDQIKLDLI